VVADRCRGDGIIDVGTIFNPRTNPIIATIAIIAIIAKSAMIAGNRDDPFEDSSPIKAERISLLACVDS
jgi:hypothetical protein